MDRPKVLLEEFTNDLYAHSRKAFTTCFTKGMNTMLEPGFLLPSWLLKFMIENSAYAYPADRDFESWQRKLFDVAENWVFSIIAVSAMVALVMLLVKWFMKKSAKGNPRKEIWPLFKTAKFIFFGLVMVFIIVYLIYLTSQDYRNFIGPSGVVKGVLSVSLITYCFLMGIFHWLLWPSDFHTRKS
jgi:MFS family permease